MYMNTEPGNYWVNGREKSCEFAIYLTLSRLSKAWSATLESTHHELRDTMFAVISRETY